jgi:hypothetical protein
MDEAMRTAMRMKVERHQKSRLWVILGRARCRICGMRWPCPAHERARRALSEQPSTPDWLKLGTEPQIAVAPLLTYGQRYRAGGQSR